MAAGVAATFPPDGGAYDQLHVLNLTSDDNEDPWRSVIAMESDANRSGSKRPRAFLRARAEALGAATCLHEPYVGGPGPRCRFHGRRSPLLDELRPSASGRRQRGPARSGCCVIRSSPPGGRDTRRRRRLRRRPAGAGPVRPVPARAMRTRRRRRRDRGLRRPAGRAAGLGRLKQTPAPTWTTTLAPRRRHDLAALVEAHADRCMLRRRRMHDDFVSVKQELPIRAVGELDRLAAPVRPVSAGIRGSLSAAGPYMENERLHPPRWSVPSRLREASGGSGDPPAIEGDAGCPYDATDP